MNRKTTRRTRRQGIIFILSAPSGAGKTTLIKGLRAVYPDIRLSVSCTTRPRRQGEVEGRDYRFVTLERFVGMKARGEFAESAKVHGYFYGTGRKVLDRCVRRGEDILLDIDVQGARRIKRNYPGAVSIFLLPPSMRVLQHRLALRRTDGRDTILRRLANARGEIRQIIKYDYYVINREVEAAVALLVAIVQAERARIYRVRQGAWRRFV